MQREHNWAPKRTSSNDLLCGPFPALTAVAQPEPENSKA